MTIKRELTQAEIKKYTSEEGAYYLYMLRVVTVERCAVSSRPILRVGYDRNELDTATGNI